MPHLDEMDIDLLYGDQVDDETLDLLFEVRDELLKLLPEANEVIKWDGLFYLKPGGSAPIIDSICHLAPRKGTIVMGFLFGAYLPDPDRLLTGRAKHKRDVILTDPKQVRSPAIRNLLKAAQAFDPADRAS